jgi:hypothetical protein
MVNTQDATFVSSVDWRLVERWPFATANGTECLGALIHSTGIIIGYMKVAMNREA